MSASSVEVMRISERERAILATAEWIKRSPGQGDQGYGDGWFKAMNVGGSNRSHHSATLMKMVGKGLIEVQPQMPGTRWNRIYRITEFGLRVYASLQGNQ